MPRNQNKHPRLIRLAAIHDHCEAAVRHPGTFADPEGTITTHKSKTAVGAIAEALIEYPDLVGVDQFTEANSR